MAQSPISIYKKVLNEFGIDDSLNVSTVGRLTYVQEQAGQQKAILNRLLFDLTVALYHQAEAKDDTSRDAHRKKADDYRNDIRQIKGALSINLKLVEELRREYPELKAGE